MSEHGRPGRIVPGPIKGQISARAWNRAQDAADIVLGQQFTQTADGPQAAPLYTPILVKNSTTGAVSRWGVLGIAGVVFTPSGTTGTATQQFMDQPMLSGGLPTGGTAFVVAVEPIAASSVGRCAVAGVVQVKMTINDTTHQFATAKDGDLTQLTSSTSGDVQILWKENATGSGKWALVRFAGDPSPTRLGKASGTWTKGATASVTEWRGDGSAVVTGPSGPATYTVVNRAQTVTGPTGGFWVGFSSRGGTWHLDWTECS